jgi:hypothetical protein
VVRVPGYRSRGPRFDSQRYQIFWEIVGVERGPLSLIRITEELLEWKSSGSGLKTVINSRGNPLCWPRNTLYPQKLALTSPTSSGRFVSIVCLWTKATEFSLVFNYPIFDLSYYQNVLNRISIIFPKTNSLSPWHSEQNKWIYFLFFTIGGTFDMMSHRILACGTMQLAEELVILFKKADASIITTNNNYI